MTDNLGQQKFFTYEKIEEMTNEYFRRSMKAKNTGDVDKALLNMKLAYAEASTNAALENEKLRKFTGRQSGHHEMTKQRKEFLRMAREEISAKTKARFAELVVQKYKKEVRNLWTRNDEKNMNKILNFIKNIKF